MAGIGFKLNKIYNRGTVTSLIYGAGYSTGITIAPFILIISTIVLMENILHFDKTAYSSQTLFSCTILDIFIISEISIAPGNTVLSKYVEDKIYSDRYEDILPGMYVGLFQQLLMCNLLGLPIYLRLFFVGKVVFYYVMLSYFGMLSLSLALYFMLFLSITKDYAKISLYFLLGMIVTAVMSFILVKLFSASVSVALLIGLIMGFVLTAFLEVIRIKAYFRENSHMFGDVLTYYKANWRLLLANLFYILGLFGHNFVFWLSDMRMIVAKTYVTANPYDVASTIAMFTNISANVIFIVQIERIFNDRYKNYSESVIGGRFREIKRAKSRLMRATSGVFAILARYQFSISVFIFLIFCGFMRKFGFTGMVMEIYPSLAAGYFILFMFFSLLSFLYYYKDDNGALLSSFVFMGSIILFSFVALKLFSPKFYGLGAFLGSIAGFTVGYARLRWCERNLYAQTFNVGDIIKNRSEIIENKPVYSIYTNDGDKKKLLFVVNTMGRAGAETSLCELLKRIDPQKYRIDLLSLIPAGEMFDKIPNYVNILNSKYSAESVHNRKGRIIILKKILGSCIYKGTVFRDLPYFFRVLKSQRKLKKVKHDKLLWKVISDGTKPAETEYDLAVAYLEGAATYYVADKVKAGKKAAFIHIHYSAAGYSETTDLGCYENIDKIFPIAEGVKAEFLKVYPQYEDKTEIFHNPIDIMKIKTLSLRDGGFESTDNHIKLLTVGRLHEQKGYDIAIKACKLLVDNRYDVVWYIVGEGAERKKLETLIAENGLKDRFILLGRKENPYPFYAGCDIYVHATRFEGKSIAVSEAQILGKPIVASNISGNREQIINGVDGLLVDLNEEAIYKAVASLIDNKEYMTELGQKAALKKQDFEEDIKMLENLAQGGVKKTEKEEIHSHS